MFLDIAAVTGCPTVAGFPLHHSTLPRDTIEGTLYDTRVFRLQVTWHGMKCDRIVSLTNTTRCESKCVCGGTAKRHENGLPSVGRVEYEVGLPVE